MRYPRTLGAILVAALVIPAAVSAQSTDPAWLDKVSEQLAREEQCLVEFFINVREGELATRKTFEARAQCRDGRQFDATRTEPEEEFTLRICEVVVC